MLHENVDSDGGINNSRMTAALLMYKNTPDRDTGMTPAEYVFGKKMNDMLPSTVKILGSGRLTYRNRQHLWQYMPHMLEYNHRDESGSYFSDPSEKYEAKLDTKTQVQPEVNQQKPTSQTLNTDPVNTE